MSGINPRAELVLVPTFAPPVKYKLLVYEHQPELENLITGSASALFAASAADEKIGKVLIEDSVGTQEVEITIIINIMEKSDV